VQQDPRRRRVVTSALVLAGVAAAIFIAYIIYSVSSV